MRRGLAVMLPVLVLAGCGVSSSDRTFDASLIRQVGAGSDEVASIIPTIHAQLNTTNAFSDPRTNQAVTFLARGQLNKLTQQDFVRMAKANHNSASEFPVAVGKLDALASSIASASVDVKAHSNLSGGAKRFIAVWDEYLASVAAQVRVMREVFTGFQPTFNEFQALLRVAYDTARLRSTVKFDRVRRTFLKNASALYGRAQTALKAATAQTAADRRLIDLVGHNQEARAIVKKVNHDNPLGSLAHEFPAA